MPFGYRDEAPQCHLAGPDESDRPDVMNPAAIQIQGSERAQRV